MLSDKLLWFYVLYCLVLGKSIITVSRLNDDKVGEDIINVKIDMDIYMLFIYV